MDQKDSFKMDTLYYGSASAFHTSIHIGNIA